MNDRNRSLSRLLSLLMTRGYLLVVFSLMACPLAWGQPAQEAGLSDSQEIWVNIFPGGTRIYGLWRDVREPDVLYAATHRGLFKTTDRGFYWAPVFLIDAKWLTLEQSEQSPNLMYLGGSLEQRSDTYVWKSEDSGKTWAPVGKGILNAAVTQIAIDPQQNPIVYVLSGGQLFKTRNGGATWARITPELDLPAKLGYAGRVGPPIPFFTIDPNNPKHLLAGATLQILRNYLVESHDGGLSWEVSGIGRRPGLLGKDYDEFQEARWSFLYFHPENRDLLVAGFLGGPVESGYVHIPGLIISRDGGTTWRNISVKGENTGVPRPTWGAVPRMNWLAFQRTATGALYLGTDSGLFI
jgi:hypothetical protein